MRNTRSGKGKQKVEQSRKALGEISGNVQGDGMAGYCFDAVNGLDGGSKQEFESDSRIDQGFGAATAHFEGTGQQYDFASGFLNEQIDPRLLGGDSQAGYPTSGVDFGVGFIDTYDDPFAPSKFDHTFGRRYLFVPTIRSLGTPPPELYLPPSLPSTHTPEAVGDSKTQVNPKRRKHRYHRERDIRHDSALATPKKEKEEKKEKGELDESELDSPDRLECQGYDLFTMSWPSITGSVSGPPRAAQQTPNLRAGGIGGHLQYYLQLRDYDVAPPSTAPPGVSSMQGLASIPGHPSASWGMSSPNARLQASGMDAPQPVPSFGYYGYGPLSSNAQRFQTQEPSLFAPGPAVGTTSNSRFSGRHHVPSLPASAFAPGPAAGLSSASRPSGPLPIRTLIPSAFDFGPGTASSSSSHFSTVSSTKLPAKAHRLFRHLVWEGKPFIKAKAPIWDFISPEGVVQIGPHVLGQFPKGLTPENISAACVLRTALELQHQLLDEQQLLRSGSGPCQQMKQEMDEEMKDGNN
ncbi:hypothetical protein BDV96DRAFT_605207 [Lophiotrema nucula]|uniref:Uncharacterized protein n=1 Tax=Lophiotrema nucula TaxID=690887 RepID=A0A6A5YNC2_9PLEO|nr:hypothetical protein BDV96DRAFT_605207 [Lophiotrema nucula]